MCVVVRRPVKIRSVPGGESVMRLIVWGRRLDWLTNRLRNLSLITPAVVVGLFARARCL